MIIPIEFDIHNQSLHIGETAFPFVPADSLHPGAVRVGHEEDSAVLRPLTFGERYEISMRAAMTGDPVEALCQWMLQASTLECSGAPDQDVLETMALIVSGGNEETPPYTESLRMLSTQAGWSIDHIEKASSTFVDRILTDLAPKQDDGWTRVLFGNDAKDIPVSIPEARKKLAENLLRRLDPGFVAEAENQQTVSLPASVSEKASSTLPGPDSKVPTPPRDNKAVSANSLAGKQSETTNLGTQSSAVREGFSDQSSKEKSIQNADPIVRHRNHLPAMTSVPSPLMASRPTVPGPDAPSLRANSQLKSQTDSDILSNLVPPTERGTPQYSSTQNVVLAKYTTLRHTGAQDLKSKEDLFFPEEGSQQQPRPSASLEMMFQSTFFHSPTDLPQPASVARPYGPGPAMQNRHEEDPFHIAQQLALLLDQEADLRGIDR